MILARNVDVGRCAIDTIEGLPPQGGDVRMKSWWPPTG